jgi:hypothetical protein
MGFISNGMWEREDSESRWEILKLNFGLWKLQTAYRENLNQNGPWEFKFSILTFCAVTPANLDEIQCPLQVLRRALGLTWALDRVF